MPNCWPAAFTPYGSTLSCPPASVSLPRRGSNDDIRWFDASPTYVLHWINAFEDGDEIVVDGFFERNPGARIDPSTAAWSPGRDDAERWMFRFLDATTLDPVPYRWRLDLRTGLVKEEILADAVSEFGTISGRHLGRPYRYCYSLLPVPGWFLFRGIRRTDVDSGSTDDFIVDDGVFVSEAQLAPRPDARAEDDGYVVTFTTDVNEDRSECLVFDATRPCRRPSRPCSAARTDLHRHPRLLDAESLNEPLAQPEPIAEVPTERVQNRVRSSGPLSGRWSSGRHRPSVLVLAK